MIKNIYEHKPASGGAPKQMVILLHGVGSNGQDLISLAPYYARFLPDAVFISPDAPFPYDMAPPGYDAYQWFSLQDRSFANRLEGVKAASPLLHDFMDRQLERYGIPPSKLVLMGFSQGTMTGLYAGPRYKNKIAGILGYSGALIWEEELPKDINVIPVHLVHGDEDEVVPFAAYHHAKEKLEKSGFRVSGHVSHGLGHSIDDGGITSGAAFLQAVLG
ncbi:MAG: phospholipase [Alphaproteobacteria bacterium]